MGDIWEISSIFFSEILLNRIEKEFLDKIYISYLS